jgi:hypothetical protein
MVLLWLAAGIGLLYFWLVGHWFARVLAFLLFAVPLVILGWGIGEKQTPGGVGMIFTIPFGGYLAWLLSGVPVYYWRSKARAIFRREEQPRPYLQH